MECTLCSLVLHGILAVLFVLSSLPIPLPKRISRPAFAHYSQAAAHGILGSLFIAAPGWFLSATVNGEFTPLHSFLQAYIGVFHLAQALSSLYFGPPSSSEPSTLVFSRFVTAFFVLFTRLFAAWHLSEKSTRGLLISDSFVMCSLLVDGAWLVSEGIRFYRIQRSAQDEVDALCKRTSQWLEGKGSLYLERALLADSAIALCMCLFHFAFPQNILKLLIRSEHTLDSHHYMWCRVFGALWLLPSLASLSAVHFHPEQQMSYLLHRLLTQVGIFGLNIYGHWAVALYSPNHISAFMISGFFMSFHFSLFYRFRHFFAADSKTKVSTRIETKKVK